MSQSSFESVKRIHTAAKALLMQTGNGLQKVDYTKEYQVARVFIDMEEVLDALSSAIEGNEFNYSYVEGDRIKMYSQSSGYLAFHSQEYRLKNLMVVFRHAHSQEAKMEAFEIIKKAYTRYCYYALRTMDQKMAMLGQRKRELVA